MFSPNLLNSQPTSKTNSNKKIIAFQCDNGGEPIQTYIHDIKFRFSCPHTSQQNGKSERMLRTINNIIRTLLFHAHIPPTYWVEALYMATHLLNILPSTSIKNETPHFRFFKSIPHIHTFAYLGVFVSFTSPPLPSLNQYHYHVFSLDTKPITAAIDASISPPARS